MTVVDMVLKSMKSGEIVTHFKKGNSNFFLRALDKNLFILDKITKGCSCGVICGNKTEINEFVSKNNFKLIGFLKR